MVLKEHVTSSGNSAAAELGAVELGGLRSEGRVVSLAVCYEGRSGM